MNEYLQMSRLNDDDIWNYHILVSESNCLCCNKNKMYRDVRDTWRLGHIIHNKNSGPDIYENIRPICPTCNIKDKPFEDSYAYMVRLGTMSASDRKKKLAHIMSRAVEIMKNPKEQICESYTENGRRCVNRKKPHMRTCKRHGPSIQSYMYKHMESLLQIHLNTMKFLLEIGEVEEYYEIKQMADETKVLLDSIA